MKINFLLTLFQSLCTECISMFPPLIWKKINEIQKSHAYHIHLAYKTVGLSSCRTSDRIPERERVREDGGKGVPSPYILLRVRKWNSLKSKDYLVRYNVNLTLKKNNMTGVMRNSTSQFSESDVKVCEFESSKSRHVNPEMVLLAAFDLHFLFTYIV